MAEEVIFKDISLLAQKNTLNGREKIVISDAEYITPDMINEGKESSSNKTSSWQNSPDDIHYPTEKLVKEALDTKYTKPQNGIPASDLETGTIPSELSQLSDDNTHRLVTDLEKESWNAKQDIFVAEYDVTPFTDVITACLEGKTVIVTERISGETRAYTLCRYEGDSVVGGSANFVSQYSDSLIIKSINSYTGWSESIISLSVDTSLSDYSNNAIANSTVKAALDAEKVIVHTDSSSTTATQELAHNNEYRFTANVASLTISVPVSMPNDYITWLVFTSGSTATSITYDLGWKWSGDDVSTTFVPAANKTYNICIWYDGVNINAVVRGI